ncbi:MAG: tyrosine--tRNA ligase [Acetatifactor sp.]|nr:tyrosine--tRNA ligase [Acetatifactor sp.]
MEKREKNEVCVENDVRHSLRVIKQGAAELIGEEELEEKLRRSILTGKPLTIKFGMDPSAPDIHLGHAVALRKLKQLQDLGHRVVVVIGDFTGRIGDSTGRSKGRKALTDEEVLVNAQTYQEQIFHILDREKTQVRYNGEWLGRLNLSEVLELASTITVARMLERDDFQNRFRNNIPIGLHEFFYPLMQAYDSVVLEADLELGGTDQTFNILMGRSLQRERGQECQAALFMPVLEGIDGVEKMSKSLGNYIGVHEDARTMFTKVMQVPDSLIIKYFELATDIQPEELDKVKEELADGGNPRDAKLLLARTITALYNGEEEAEAAQKFFREAFTERLVPEDADILQVIMEKGNLLDCVRPLVNGGYVGSGAEFRRLVAQGGVQKNGERVKDMEEKVQTGDVLKVGKRRFVRVKIDM